MLQTQFENITPAIIAERALALANAFPHLAGPRLVRAQLIAAAKGTILETQQGVFLVQSESNPAGKYTVNTSKKSCTCPDAGAGRVCKHRLAVALYCDWRQSQTPAREEPLVDAADLPLYGHISWYGVGRYLRLLVRVVAVDAEAGTVIVQCVERDSTGQRYTPFKYGGYSASTCTITPAELMKWLSFTPSKFQAAHFED